MCAPGNECCVSFSSSIDAATATTRYSIDTHYGVTIEFRFMLKILRSRSLTKIIEHLSVIRVLKVIVTSSESRIQPIYLLLHVKLPVYHCHVTISQGNQYMIDIYFVDTN